MVDMLPGFYDLKPDEHRLLVRVVFRYTEVEQVLFAFHQSDTQFVERIQQRLEQHNKSVGVVTYTSNQEVVYHDPDIKLSDDKPIRNHLGVIISMFDRDDRGELALLKDDATRVIGDMIMADKMERLNDQKAKKCQPEIDEIEARFRGLRAKYPVGKRSKADLIRIIMRETGKSKSALDRLLRKWK